MNNIYCQNDSYRLESNDGKFKEIIMREQGMRMKKTSQYSRCGMYGHWGKDPDQDGLLKYQVISFDQPPGSAQNDRDHNQNVNNRRENSRTGERRNRAVSFNLSNV